MNQINSQSNQLDAGWKNVSDVWHIKSNQLDAGDEKMCLTSAIKLLLVIHNGVHKGVHKGGHKGGSMFCPCLWWWGARVHGFCILKGDILKFTAK